MLYSITYVVYSFVVIASTVVCEKYELKITSNAPAVHGSTIEFHADLYTYGELDKGKYKFYWKDDAIPQHNYQNTTSEPHSDFSVTYSGDDYPPGWYTMEVVVEYTSWIIDYRLTSKRMEFEVTGLINGELLLTQNGTVQPAEFVSSAVELNQTILISPTDMEYLSENATDITTHWFVDCKYLGASNNLTFVRQYLNENQKYDIEVLVVASFEPLPEPTTTPIPTTTTPTTTTTTTTTTPSTTTPSTTTPSTTTTSSTTPTPPTTTSSTTTIPPTSPSTTTSSPTITTSSTTIKSKISKRETVTQDLTNVLESIVGSSISTTDYSTEPSTTTATSLSSVTPTIDHPYVCFNKSSISADPKKLYGYFHRQIIVKNPISDVTISGNLWLQYGDVLELEVKYTGSPPFQYCVDVEAGSYNVTGNETCTAWVPNDDTSFPITRLFHETYTMIIIIRNSVIQVNKGVKVNIYAATKQSQLSVIVVPVVFCLAAIISVIFGVAYYMQNRSRFAVEVADFNFGETASIDMEYKTFRQRLFDSVREVFSRRNEHGSSTSLEYGPMIEGT